MFAIRKIPAGIVAWVVLLATIPFTVNALVITSPQDGASFKEGESVTIKVEPSPGDPPFVLGVLIFPPQESSDICPVIHQAPYECRVTLLPGNYRIRSIGAVARPLSGEPVFADDVSILVKVTATLIGLRVNDDQRTFFSIVDSSRKLYIYGKYSDGIDRRLDDPATGTTYETSDPKVATVDIKGLVTSVAPGKAVITVRNGEHKLQVPVIVDKE